MDLFLAEKRIPGPRLAMWWWEQEVLDLGGMRKAAQEAEQMEGTEETDGSETATYD